MLLTLVIAYLLITIAIGLVAAKRVKNSADFAIAGRHLPLAMIVTTTFATWFGSETVLGIPAKFVNSGLNGVVEDPFGAGSCLILVGLFFAGKLYRMNLLTISDYYRERYGRSVEILCSIIIMVSYLGWVSAQVTALGLVLSARQHAAAMDSLALVNTLHKAIALERIDTALQNGVLQALAVTASSYSSGVHWTFCQTRDGQPIPWSRPGRRAEQQPITIEHLMASSAIPFIFPSTPLWVDGGMEFFGDGSMRQISPLASAVHLGADRILAIGVGQPQRATLGGDSRRPARPSLGTIAGHAMASVFHDTLEADVEQIARINLSLKVLPAHVRAELPFRSVEVLTLQPSASLDGLAQAHAHSLPKPIVRVLEGLGALQGSGAALASYLLFEPGFIGALMALGRADVHARADEITSFLSPNRPDPVR